MTLDKSPDRLDAGQRATNALAADSEKLVFLIRKPIDVYGPGI
jgi:hypothetical protein